MNAIALLETLQRDGIRLRLDGDNLRIQAPKGAMTPAVRDRLLEHKQALIDWLRESHVDDGEPLPACEPDPASLYAPFPLSDLQMGFYMAEDAYMEFHVRPHYYLEKDHTDFDPDRYERAWQRALHRHRHDIVRVDGDGMLETVRDVAPLPVKRIDLRGCDEQTREASLARTRREMARSELPLTSWPWLDLRISLWREDGVERARIHYNHNNFFSDGYGTTRLLQEVDRYYAQPDLALPPLRLAFRDAALALDRLAASSAGRAARRYWEDRLPHLPPALELPTRSGMDRRSRSMLQRREGFIDAPAWQAFKRHAERAGLTPSNAVFAAYAEVLATWGNSRHFIVSNMMTRRLNIHPEIREILGNFASLYPLEIDLRGRASFTEGARRIQEQVIRDARRLEWGGMKVMQALSRQQGNFGAAAVPFVIGSGLFMENFERADFSCLETSQVMLDHQFWELRDGTMYYVWDLLEDFFPAGMVDAMWSAYRKLVAQLAGAPEAWAHNEFDLLTDADKALRAGPALPPLPEPCGSLGDLVGMAAGRDPDAAAVWDGDRRRSYADLYAASRAVCRALSDAGLRPGQAVAIVAERGAAMLAAVHGTLMAGGVYVPVDPALPQERRDYILDNAGARHVLAGRDHAQTLAWPAHATVLALDGLPAEAAASARFPKPVVEPTDLAYLIYTSGSTGRPKGVMIDHRGAMNTVLDVNGRYGVAAHDVLFGVSSFGFDLSVYDIFGAAAAGAAVVYPDPRAHLNPAHWLDLMLARDVTIWNSAPPLAVLLADAAETRGIRLPALRLVMMSGDWIPVDLIERLRAVAPNARIVSMGGATEASIWSIFYDIGQVDPAWTSIPYGYPMRNQSWDILDERMMPVPAWVPGELYIGGIGLAHGYRGDAAKTAAAFVTHPRTGETWYRTGDIGRYVKDGWIEFLGRRDSQVKVRGHRIELGEIESVLLSEAAVAHAVVVVQKGDGKADQLAAHLVRKPGSELDAGQVQRLLAAKLPDYMVPRLIGFLDRLPLSANGKIDRKALPVLGEPAAPAAARLARPPAGATEMRLAGIWRKVLRVPDVGVGDDFFSLGGQSFEAVRIAGLVKETMGVALSLGDIWRYPTIAELAAHLDGAAAGGARAHDGLVTIRAGGAGTPLFLVHPAGGNVMCYRHLGALLARPVHAFEAVGVDGRAAPLTSVPEMAADYVRKLLAFCPEGPVVLGGWSSGGPIAFEMARQLRRQGRPVGGVAIFDSPAPTLLDEVEEPELARWFIEDLDPGPAAKQCLAGWTPVGGDDTAVLAQAAAHLEAHGLALGADSGQLAVIYRVFKAIVRANRAYRTTPIDTDLLIVRARDGMVSEFALHPHAATDHWGWAALTSGRVATHAVGATHYTLLQAASAPVLAAALEDWLGGRDRTTFLHPTTKKEIR
jgi:amino acid adenylation domain-containing protein